MKTERQERLLSSVDKHVSLTLSSPFLLAAFFILLYYLSGSELRRVLNFLTFSK